MKEYYETGKTVPHSGIYRVIHENHVLPREVTLLKDQFFPRCAACERAVLFLPLRIAPGLERSDVRITIYELPVLGDRGKSKCPDEISAH